MDMPVGELIAVLDLLDRKSAEVRGWDAAQKCAQILRNRAGILAGLERQIADRRAELETAGQAIYDRKVSDAETRATRIVREAEQQRDAVDAATTVLREEISRLNSEIESKRAELAGLQQKVSAVAAALKG